jgi:serine/threonine protein phosphatase PrpC
MGGEREIENDRETERDRDISLFAVFDGHGGRVAADFAANYFPAHLKDVLYREEKEKTETGETEQETETEGEQETERERLRGLQTLSDEAIVQCFINCDAAYKEAIEKDDIGSDGTTACMVLVERRTDRKIARETERQKDRFLVKFVNLGDSRALLVSLSPPALSPSFSRSLSLSSSSDTSLSPYSLSAKIKLATKDHKPTEAIERARIEAAGSFVSMGRVQGQLSLSRSLGDFRFKGRHERDSERDKERDRERERFRQNPLLRNPLSSHATGKESPLLGPAYQPISSVPEVYTTCEAQEGDLVVLACDGLFEVQTNTELCALIARRLHAHMDVLAAEYVEQGRVCPDWVDLLYEVDLARVCSEVVSLCLQGRTVMFAEREKEREREREGRVASPSDVKSKKARLAETEREDEDWVEAEREIEIVEVEADSEMERAIERETDSEAEKEGEEEREGKMESVEEEIEEIEREIERETDLEGEGEREGEGVEQWVSDGGPDHSQDNMSLCLILLGRERDRKTGREREKEDELVLGDYLSLLEEREREKAEREKEREMKREREREREREIESDMAMSEIERDFLRETESELERWRERVRDDEGEGREMELFRTFFEIVGYRQIVMRERQRECRCVNVWREREEGERVTVKCACSL